MAELEERIADAELQDGDGLGADELETRPATPATPGTPAQPARQLPPEDEDLDAEALGLAEEEVLEDSHDNRADRSTGQAQAARKRP